eukprot:CAMPEP_0198341446 /NCGR_PEP_ID=MMETSP1450-20131203/47921_1 /TAXON_ID=753684 ORGANISM="Madagascaria erythrocladiodes, Strain CCMP3234" /NCGR_SAMPLE_ID=MMETSP1450 /ASSEMBLY_ACC=CAM_ASM_001115 /LENGTH=177 /DNA_ID=CAMNT_0044046477 /DNA_START=39 /DNA_END=572 /DNA_ORIENTATION=+
MARRLARGMARILEQEPPFAVSRSVDSIVDRVVCYFPSRRRISFAIAIPESPNTLTTTFFDVEIAGTDARAWTTSPAAVEAMWSTANVGAMALSLGDQLGEYQVGRCGAAVFPLQQAVVEFFGPGQIGKPAFLEMWAFSDTETVFSDRSERDDELGRGGRGTPAAKPEWSAADSWGA